MDKMAQTPHLMEHTRLLGNSKVFHYTCNPPSLKILQKYGIESIGKNLGCRDDREVLLIPAEAYVRFGLAKNIEGLRGIESLTIASEQLLKRMENKHKAITTH